MQGGGSAPLSRDVESPMDEGRDAVDASRDHGVHGPEPVFALGAGVGLESGLFVGWVLVKTWPNPATFLPWYLKLAATFKVAGFLKLRHWVIARGGNIFPHSCQEGALLTEIRCFSKKRIVQKAVLSSQSVWLDLLRKPGYCP